MGRPSVGTTTVAGRQRRMGRSDRSPSERGTPARCVMTAQPSAGGRRTSRMPTGRPRLRRMSASRRSAPAAVTRVHCARMAGFAAGAATALGRHRHPCGAAIRPSVRPVGTPARFGTTVSSSAGVARAAGTGSVSAKFRHAPAVSCPSAPATPRRGPSAKTVHCCAGAVGPGRATGGRRWVCHKMASTTAGSRGRKQPRS